MTLLRQIKNRSVISVFILLTITSICFLKYRGWDFDDSYIVYRVVDRIKTGFGWSFNDGESLNVSTSVLNTVLISIISESGISVPLSAHIVGFIGLLLTGFCSYILFLRFNHWILSLASSSLLVVYLSNNLTWGLETHFFTGLFFLCLTLPSGLRKTELLMGFLVLARPDGVLLPMMQAAYRGITFGIGKMLNRKMLWLFVPVLPWVVFSFINFHQIFPDTLSNKMWQARSGLWGVGNIFAKNLLEHLMDLSIFGLRKEVLYPLALLGLFRANAKKTSLMYFFAFAAIQQIAYIIINVPLYHWYTAYLDAAILTLVLIGFQYIVAYIISFFNGLGMGWPSRVWLNFFYAPLAGVIALIVFFASITPLIEDAYRHPVTDTRTIAYRNGATAIRNLAPHSKSFAAFEVGVFGYYLSHMSAVDLTGLTSVRGEFITGLRNDLYFIDPASIFISYDPPTHFEQPILDDPRFALYYDLIGESHTPGFKNLKIYSKKAHINYTNFAKKEVDFRLAQSASCQGDLYPGGTVVIDQLGSTSAPQLGATIKIKGIELSVRGWASGPNLELVASPVLLLRNDAGLGYSLTLNPQKRRDVASAFGKTDLIDAGFASSGGIGAIPSGTYKVEYCGRMGGAVFRKDTGLVVKL